MLVVRSIRSSDLEQLYDLIQRSEYGLTTLKVSKDRLASRIENAVFAFQQKDGTPAGQPYVFVMVDHANQGQIVGTSAIYSKTGGFEPLYLYEIKTSVQTSKDLGVSKEIEILHLQREHDGPSEIGSLFLSPDYWGDGLGRLLSLSRFLFIAEFLDRFEPLFIAEMRGVVNRNGHSPFWDALGSHFFDINFPRAETQTAQSKRFIADLMPVHPIYIPLLPQSAQDVIGKVHPNTEPALEMLKKEGFGSRNFVDIFDGGPTLHCDTKDIRSVRDSVHSTIAEVLPELEVATCLVSNCRLDFRACIGKVQMTSDGQCRIDQQTAEVLEISTGDSIRWAVSRPAGTKQQRKATRKTHVSDTEHRRPSD